MILLYVNLEQSPSKVRGKVPLCAYGGERKREHFMLGCKNGINCLISLNLGMQDYTRHHISVSCTIRWLGEELLSFCSQAKMGSIMPLHRDHPTP
eukprot:1157334-Pelagomonas_calceolata.AAC.3